MKLLNNDKTILIVGLGLIGGSYARALKKLGFTVNAITRSQETVDYAMQEGIVDYATNRIEPKLIAGAKLIVFSLYPHVFMAWLKENQKYFSPGTILTDVTGVKTEVVYPVQEMLREDVEFIAAHPMAGREVYGVKNSDDAIFHGANYIVIPTEKNTPEAIALCEDLGRLLGFSTISRLTPQQHDDMIAFLSQLTHCIAVSLMTCNDSEDMQKYTGDSFRDLTRIARINDAMWSELFLMNKEALLKHMELFEKEFHRLKNALKNDDAETMREMMRLSSERRALFDK